MNEDVEEIISKIKNVTNVFEKALLILSLKKDKNLRIVDISRLLSESPSKICQLLRLPRLPDIVIEGYLSKTLSITHLIILSRIKNENTLIDIYEKILTNDLSTMQTEDLVRQHIYKIDPKGAKLLNEERQNIITLVNKIDPNLEVQIIQTRVRAKIILQVRGNLDKTTQVLKKINDLFAR